MGFLGYGVGGYGVRSVHLTFRGRTTSTCSADCSRNTIGRMSVGPRRGCRRDCVIRWTNPGCRPPNFPDFWGEPKPRGHDSPRRPKPDRSPHPQAIGPFPCQPGTVHLRGAMGSDSQCGPRLSSGPNSTALRTISAIRPRLAPGARVTFIATAPLMQSAADKESSQPDGRFKVGCPDGDVTVADKQVDRFQCLLRTVPAVEWLLWGIGDGSASAGSLGDSEPGICDLAGVGFRGRILGRTWKTS